MSANLIELDARIKKAVVEDPGISKIKLIDKFRDLAVEQTIRTHINNLAKSGYLTFRSATLVYPTKKCKEEVGDVSGQSSEGDN